MRTKLHKLLIHAMKNLMNQVFSFDHYNYARWASVHLFDLMTLYSTRLDVHVHFLKGNFLFKNQIEDFQRWL